MGNNNSTRSLAARSQGSASGSPRIPQGFPRPEDLFSQDELKSARLVASQGPFVTEETGKLLREFYEKYAPEKSNTEFINNIVHSGMELSMLNQKLRAKYNMDLDDFCVAEGKTLQ